MSTIIIKQHDTKPRFRFAPTIDGVAAPPGTFSSVSFILKGKADDDGTDIAIKQTAVIDVDGTFYYDPVAGDVAHPGKFKQEWEAIYPSGKILTFPNNAYNSVKILADLG